MAFEHLVDPTNLNLLIHSDTNDGSTEFSDSSRNNHIVTTHGGVHHSTNIEKIGQSAMYFDGEDDFLSIESTPYWDLENRPFTIDMWVYPTRKQTGSGILSLDGTNGAPGGILFGYEDGSSTYKLFMSSTGTRWDIESGGDAGQIALFKWQHLAITRSDDSLRAFVNGAIAGTWDTKSVVYAPNSPLTIGKAGGFFQGYIDEIRISIGDAQWTTPFTPPLLEYELSEIQGKTSEIDDGDFRFFGLLALMLAIVGLLAGTSRFRLPILASILIYLLVSLVQSSFIPFELVLLNLAPVLALLAGMGLEKMVTIIRWEDLSSIDVKPRDFQQSSEKSDSLSSRLLNYATTHRYIVDGLVVFIGIVLARSLFPWWLSAIVVLPIIVFYIFSRYTSTQTPSALAARYPTFRRLFRYTDPIITVETLKIIAVLIATLAASLYLAGRMVDNSAFASTNQDILVQSVFVGVSLLSLYLALDIPTRSIRINLFTTVLVLEYLTYHYLAGRATSLSSADIDTPNYQILSAIDLPVLFFTIVVLAYLI
ncbi:LamG domain-containing protein, partial [SAR202 cluster bacterium AD-804-J14_MRT_500m]|nr:LamG domain-containing protein [SAR202 cluster bacterium AD-804-J14_MRT_500m]